MPWQRHSFNGANLFDTIEHAPTILIVIVPIFLRFVLVLVQFDYRMKFTKWTKWISICGGLWIYNCKFARHKDLFLLFNFTRFPMRIVRAWGKRMAKLECRLGEKKARKCVFIFRLRIARSCSYLNALNIPMKGSIYVRRVLNTQSFSYTLNELSWWADVCRCACACLLSSFDKLNYCTKSGIKIPWLQHLFDYMFDILARTINFRFHFIRMHFDIKPNLWHLC